MQQDHGCVARKAGAVPENTMDDKTAMSWQTEADGSDSLRQGSPGDSLRQGSPGKQTPGAVMIREYMNGLFTLPLAAWIWRPCASRFPFSREIWHGDDCAK